MVIRERQSHSLISGIDYFDAMLLSMSCDEKIPKLLTNMPWFAFCK